MLIYAGIDEAGYGPFFGPLVVARSVMCVPDDVIRSPIAAPGDNSLWQRLEDCVSRTLSRRGQRIVINDSKKVHTPASGFKHLENGILTMQGAMAEAGSEQDLLSHSDERWDLWFRQYTDTNLNQLLPWYQAGDNYPWETFPYNHDAGVLRIARAQLSKAMARENIECLETFAYPLFEDRFNEQAMAVRSKASITFRLVARHLQAIWQDHASQRPLIVVDRQSGRAYYRELLAENFPGKQITILEESDDQSTYQITETGSDPLRRMSVRFESKADYNHFPVCLASMLAKLSRELWMMRFQNWFKQKCPDIKPTLGYGVDGKRFWEDIRSRLNELDIEMNQLKRKI